MRERSEEKPRIERTTFSIKKVILIALIFFILMGTVGVMASNERLSSVKIILSSGYEMNVVTTSTKVSDILAESHVVVLDNESVTPSIDEEISDNKTIKILKYNEKEILDNKISSSFSAEEILNSYSTVVEKLITVREEIPYETITKDVSSGDNTTNQVTQKGRNGIKEVVYRVKYRNNEEIERTVVSETIIREPVNKIVEVRTVQISARSGGARASSGSIAEYQAYAEQKCYERGWTATDVDCLISLWNRESGWNVYATNKYSGAYGIPQALPGRKMAAYGADWQTNYKVQIDWGLSYIAGRYGTPSNAWAKFCSRGWY